MSLCCFISLPFRKRILIPIAFYLYFDTRVSHPRLAQLVMLLLLSQVRHLRTTLFLLCVEKLKNIMFFSHLIVPLTSSKILTLGKTKENRRFLLFFYYLIVPLTSSKALTLGKTKEKRRFLLFFARLIVPLQRLNA